MEISQEEREAVESLVSQLDGSVQSQGVRLSCRAWLDMGSREWQETDNKTRAAAYQAAKVTGWTDESIADIVRSAFPHIMASVLEYTLKQLVKWSEEYPVQVEVLRDTDDEVSVTLD